jgi:hypothetical protein
MRNLKQERYDQLVEQTEEGKEYSDEQLTERVQLFYELDPSRQYWRDESPNLTPRDVWGIDTSCYGS